MSVEWKGPDGFRSADSSVTIPNVSVENGGMYYLETTYFNTKVKTFPTYVEVYESNKVDLFEWLLDSAFVFNDLVIRQDGDYTVNLKNAYGCDSIVTLHVQWLIDSISVVPDPYFSPNGDGVKDRWFIDGVDKVPTAVKIYDRFGKAIRAYDAYSNEEGWDGKDANGRDMPSTDYWYVVSVAKADRLFVGHVALVR